jgi:hypothetical protein
MMLDADWVYFKIDPGNMTFVTRIMEGFEYVGVVTALDGKKGIGLPLPIRLTRHGVSFWPCPLW